MADLTVYSANEYYDSGAVNNVFFTKKSDAIKHVDTFNRLIVNPLDSAGLDELSIEINPYYTNEDGEVSYDISITRLLANGEPVGSSELVNLGTEA